MRPVLPFLELSSTHAPWEIRAFTILSYPKLQDLIKALQPAVDSSGVYICKSVVNDLRHEITSVTQKGITLMRALQPSSVCTSSEAPASIKAIAMSWFPCFTVRIKAGDTSINSSGVYICKSVVNDLRHGKYICKSEGIYLRGSMPWIRRRCEGQC
jgi:hypothetical protein